MPSDAKSQLKEEAEKRGGVAPTYDTNRHGGLDHVPGFKSTVIDDQGNLGEGVGRSKTQAEKDAAANLIQKRGKVG